MCPTNITWATGLPYRLERISGKGRVLRILSLGYVTLRYVWSSFDAHSEITIYSIFVFSGMHGSLHIRWVCSIFIFPVVDFIFVTGLLHVEYVFPIGLAICLRTQQHYPVSEKTFNTLQDITRDMSLGHSNYPVGQRILTPYSRL